METMRCDLVVIGSGGAGMVAAGHAAELGAKVIVLEKNKLIGGNTWFAVGTRYIHSKRGEENGMGDLRDAMFRECMSKTNWRKDPKTVHRFLDEYENVYNWFDELGFGDLTFFKKMPNGMSVMEMYERKAPHKGTEPSRGPGFVGSTIVEYMLDVCKKHDVPVLAGYQATEIHTDDSGAVCGVTAVHEGEVLEIEARAAVVATGCFSANKDLVRRAFPEHFAKPGYYACIGLSSATGDGITMCEKIGAEVLDFVELGMPGLGHHPWTWNIHAAAGRGVTMWVNKNGERMVDEATVSMDAGKAVAARQPEALIYSVVDSHILDLLQEELARTLPPNEQLYLGDLRESYEKESAQGKVHCVRGDTLEELAANMEKVAGVNAGAFLETVARYNAFCAKQHDDEMLKEAKYLVSIEKGPFFAAQLQRFYEITQGGIEVDHNMQVRKKTGGVIPGLYAAGDTSSASGNSLNGTGLALAFVSGYVAADEAVKHLK